MFVFYDRLDLFEDTMVLRKKQTKNVKLKNDSNENYEGVIRMKWAGLDDWDGDDWEDPAYWDTHYSFIEILRDVFAFSLHVGKLHFAFYLYRVY